MATAVTIFGVVFAAFCVWLTVRIVNRRERWAKRTLVAVIVGLPVLYVASFGPACWMTAADPADTTLRAALPNVYFPIGWAIIRSEAVAEAADAYGRLGMPQNTRVLIPFEIGGPYFSILRLP
jgi:hypothetical protein